MNIETLAEQPLRELELRASELAVRAQELMDNARLTGRDLDADESRVIHRHKEELESYRAAIALREQRDRQARERAAELDAAMTYQRRSSRISPIMLSAGNIEVLERARAEYRTLSVIEERSALDTSALGTATEYGGGGLAAPRNLWRASGIPTTEPPAGYAAVVPQFTIPSGTTLVSEGSDHAEYDYVTPDSVQLARTGAWSDLTSEAAISSSITDLSTAHARVIARDLDLALVTKLEGNDSGLTVDEALLTVADTAAVDVSALWIVGPVVDLAALVGNAVFTPAGGPDVESFASRYGGAAVYPTGAASAVTVFAPSGFKCFATRLASAVVVDPTDGSQRFGSWLIWGVGQGLAGAAVTVGGGSV